MAINIGENTDGDVTYKNPPVDRTLFPNIKYGATPEEIQEAVDAWLDDHPEATTTVEDGSILPVKLDSTNDATDGYVLSYNATAEKFEWYDIGGELDEINSDITDLKQDLEGLDVYTLGLYPQMSVADTAVASFTDGADDIPVKALTVDVDPVQDLHGQANPYPDGGGKNKLPMTVAGIKAANTGGSWSGNTYTYNGVTFTIQTDSDGNITGILLNGTSTAVTVFYINSSFTIKAGSYVLNGAPISSSSTETWRLQVDTSSLYIDTGGGADITVSEDYSGATSFIRVGGNKTPSNTLFKPMIRLASVSDATFAPYSNICPISGWTEANISVNGVNQWDEEWELGGISTSTGNPVANDTLIRSKNFIPVIPGAVYCLNFAKWMYIPAYDADKNYIGQLTYSRITGTDFYLINVSDEAHYIKIPFSNAYGTTYNNDVCLNFHGERDGEYEPYKGNVYHITFPTSAGTVYGGTLDVTSGVLTVDKGFYTLTGSETWVAWDSNAYYSVCLPSMAVNSSISINCISSMLVGNTADAIYSGGSGIGARGERLYVNASEHASIGTFTGMQVVYNLATPVTYQLDATAVNTILGQNNIFADTGDIAELTYRADLKAYIDAHVGS